MATIPLPNDPDIAQLKRRARELQRAVRAGDADALALVAEHHPQGSILSTATFALTSAQLVVARQHRFRSWAQLKRHLDEVARLTRAPDTVDVQADRDDEFLRLACLTYGDDGPSRWAAARQLLEQHGEIGTSSVWAAAVRADVATAERLLRDEWSADQVGGPFGWTPLLYLAYARHDPMIDQTAVLLTVELLLDAGADPNAGFLWHGLPTPMTVLTGCLGGGELGDARQPRHPHWQSVARLLLDRGAEPNDGQGLYNRMFDADDDHLVLLFEFGLGSGDGGPWKHRLGDAIDAPPALLRAQLRWALIHGMRERVRLLIDHGVDVRAPFDDGRTPAEVAAASGHRVIVADLEVAGAAAPVLVGVDGLVAAAVAGDAIGARRFVDADPLVVERAKAASPALVVHAAAAHNQLAVRLLVELGFDVNAKGRADLGTSEPWQTALHEAVAEDDLEMVTLLLALGADPDLHDRRFDATPLGWAEHFENEALIETLRPVTHDGA